MQIKLTAIQVNEVRKALESLENTMVLLSETVIGVGSRMYKLQTHLRNICEHGTTDGKPWVEPEPTIPDGYRLARPEEHVRTDVMFKRTNAAYWQGMPWNSQFEHPSLGVTYIVPIDAPIPDGYRLANADEYVRNDVKFWSNSGQCWAFRVAQDFRFDPPACGTRYIVPIDAVPPEGAKEPSREELGAELERFRSDFDEVGGLLKDDTASKGYRIAAAFSLPVIQGKIDELKAKIEKMDQDRELTDEDACVFPRLLVMGRDSRSDQWEGPLEFHGISPYSEYRFTTNHLKLGEREAFRYIRPATSQEIQRAGIDMPDNPAKVEPCRGHDQQRAQ